MDRSVSFSGDLCAGHCYHTVCCSSRQIALAFHLPSGDTILMSHFSFILFTTYFLLFLHLFKQPDLSWSSLVLLLLYLHCLSLLYHQSLAVLQVWFSVYDNHTVQLDNRVLMSSWCIALRSPHTDDLDHIQPWGKHLVSCLSTETAEWCYWNCSREWLLVKYYITDACSPCEMILLFSKVWILSLACHCMINDT